MPPKITPRQASIYRTWADHYGILPLPLTEKHRLYRYKCSKKLAEKLGVQQEHVRRDECAQEGFAEGVGHYFFLINFFTHFNKRRLTPVPC